MALIDRTHRAFSYAELRGDGSTRASIKRALEAGVLIRARRDNYVAGTSSPRVVAAVRVGGKLDCVSLLEELGVFVLRRGESLHLQIPHARRQLRSPVSRRTRLDCTAHSVVTHWRDDPSDDRTALADPTHALAQSIRCQSTWAATATLDSALHLGIIDTASLADVYALLPTRLRGIRRLVNGTAESGPETIARLIAQDLGYSVALQVVLDGVGRVDLLVEGQVIVECDSREFHGGWEAQERDRRRDQLSAKLGYTTLRPSARQLFSEPRLFAEALQGLLGPARH